MNKITRTVKATAVRYEDNGKVVTETYTNMPVRAVNTLMSAMKITDYEVGYMPVTYEMDEETFLTRASVKTKVEGSKIYATKEECPSTTVTPKSHKATS